ncbi:BON domain-containing protein [Orrella sp. 11846]|uniref:BON domain-containing protein n=1 Tax=Orrella sp. 11846 TaxID=3409913 RepID=UPI003B5B7CDB
MKLKRLIHIAVVITPLTLLATGCTVARNQETVGEYIDGSTTTVAVKAKLADNRDTSALNINVKTIDAGEVQLSGFARSDYEKARAGEIAGSVKGVKRVHNDLIVKP